MNLSVYLNGETYSLCCWILLCKPHMTWIRKAWDLTKEPKKTLKLINYKFMSGIRIQVRYNGTIHCLLNKSGFQEDPTFERGRDLFAKMHVDKLQCSFQHIKQAFKESTPSLIWNMEEAQLWYGVTLLCLTHDVLSLCREQWNLKFFKAFWRRMYCSVGAELCLTHAMGPSTGQ